MKPYHRLPMAVLPTVLSGLICVSIPSVLNAETLSQAWASALIADRGLMASREYTAAAMNTVQAAASSRLPHVSVEAAYSALGETPTVQAEFLGQSVQLPMAQQFSGAYKATATVPLYAGGRIEHGISAATEALVATQSAEISAAQELKLRVAEAFVGVLRAANGFNVVQSHVASIESHERDVKNLLDQGMVPRKDLLAAQVVLADARQQALQVAHALVLAQSNYNRLLGRPLDQAVSLEVPTNTSSNQESMPALTQRALAQRSELASMNSQMEAMRNQSAAVRAELKPQVALSGGYGYQQNRYQVYQGQWFANIGLSWNVFDGGATGHRADSIERQRAALMAQRDELASVITFQVHQTLLSVQEAKARIELTEATVAQADENLRVVRDRYANGLDTQSEVLGAEMLRVNSQTQQSNALFDILLANLRLSRAIGEL